MSLYTYHQEAIVGPVVITCPPNTTWQILTGHVLLNSSATGGNRRLRLTASPLSDPDPVWDIHPGVNQGPSRLAEYHLRQGDQRDTQFIDNDVIATIPRQAIMQTGWTLTVEDTNDVDAANDLFTIHLAINVINSLNPRKDAFL